jgi:succinate-acetate transporter protein
LAGQNEIKRNCTFGYTAFSVYGGFWMSLGIIKMVTLLATDTPVYVNPKAAQGMLFMLGVISIMFWSITFTMNKTICSLFGLLSITVFLLTFGVHNETVDTIGGYFGVATSINAFWLAYAELVNDIVGKGKHIIPLGKWNWKKNEASVLPTVPPSETSPDDVEMGRNDVGGTTA